MGLLLFIITQYFDQNLDKASALSFVAVFFQLLLVTMIHLSVTNFDGNISSGSIFPSSPFAGFYFIFVTGFALLCVNHLVPTRLKMPSAAKHYVMYIWVVTPGLLAAGQKVETIALGYLVVLLGAAWAYAVNPNPT